MAYIMIEDYSCVWPTGPTPLDPKGFAIHWWGSGTPQFLPIVQLLVNRAAQGSASVTFVAEEGQVACLTSPFEVAWGQGDGANGWGNRNLVSIECNPRCSPGDRETVAELIADQHIRNGIPINLYPHKKFTATQCPGVWEQWIPWLTKRANEIVAEKRSGTTPKPVEEEDKMIIIATNPADGTGMVWSGDGVVRRHIPNPKALGDLQWLGNNGFLKVANGGQVAEIGDLDAIGRDLGSIASEVLYKEFDWYGFDGVHPTEGRTKTNVAIQQGWADAQVSALDKNIKEVGKAVADIGEVKLSPEDLNLVVTKVTEAVIKTLAPTLAADLAKRLAE